MGKHMVCLCIDRYVVFTICYCFYFCSLPVWYLYTAELAKTNLSGVLSSFRAYNAVWAVTLFGALIPYVFYCFYLFFRNKSIIKYKVTTNNFFWAILMGFLWFFCITLYGAGASNLGRLGTTISWLILMSCTVIVGNLWGWITGEWKYAPQKAQQKMKIGLVLLFLSVVMVAVAKLYLWQKLIIIKKM